MMVMPARMTSVMKAFANTILKIAMILMTARLMPAIMAIARTQKKIATITMNARTTTAQADSASTTGLITI